MDSITSLLLSATFLIVLIFLIRNLKWIISELRCICENESGYVKLVQLIFVILILASFFALLVYNFIFRESTSKLDVFLTVVVGLMGTIMGTFFSERTIESIKKDRDFKRRVILQKKHRIEETIDSLNKLLQKLD